MECYLERVFYYWRHGMFGHAEAVCRIGLEDKPSNLFLIIYHSLSIGMMRRTDEAIQLASKLSQRKDLILLYQTSLFCIHSHANPKNEAVMDELRSNIISKIESSNPLALYHAAQIAWMFNERWIYKGILKHCKEKQINFPNLSVLKGWMMLKASHAKSALKKFDSVLEDKTKSFDILALYGKALCYAYMNDYSDSVQVYARILSKYDFPELNVEKCRIYIQMERWEYSYSIAQELKEKLFSKVEPDIIIAMNSLLRSESEQDVSAILDELVSECMKFEPLNWGLQMKICMALATISSQNLFVIDRLLQLALNSTAVSNKDQTCNSILGFTQLIARNYVAALSSIPDPADNDQSDPLGIEFQIRLLIDTGRYSEAQDMLDLYGIINHSKMIYNLLQSKINRKTIYSNESNIKPLLSALEEHLNSFRNNDLPFKPEETLELQFEKYPEFFIKFRIDAILDSLDELITFNYSGYNGPTKEIGNKLISLITPLLKSFPNFAPFTFFMALLLKHNDKIDDSQFLFEKSLVSPSIYRLSQCLLNIAEIFYNRNQIEFAASCVEEASVIDPTLIHNLDFVILKSQVTSSVKDSLSFMAQLINSSQQPLVNYLKFIDLCISVNDFDTASTFIKASVTKISHPSDKALIILRQAHIFAHHKNYQKAIESLDALQKHKRFVEMAIEAKAEIYLRYIDDQTKYISVLNDYAKQNPSPISYAMLGQGMKKLKMFNSAIDAFKQGFDRAHPDEVILKELIMTYISANHFDEAVHYFTCNAQIMRSSSIFSMDFISLMIEMKRYKEARMCIARVMQILNQNNKLAQAGIQRLHGIVQSRLKEYAISNTYLQNSINTYEELIKGHDENSYIKHIKEIMSSVMYEIGENYTKLQEREKAIECYNRSIEYNQVNNQAVVSLFNLFKGRYDTDKCKNVCKEYLENDDQNETVALLLTSTQANSLYESIPYLTRVLDSHPTYFRTLVRLVEICARSGRLNTALAYIKKAKCSEPGFYFVQGLYFTYVGNPEKAMKFYKLAMNNNRWEVPAKTAIFGILVNPDRKYLWFEDEPLSSPEKLDEAENILSTIRTEENYMKLLKCDLLCSRNTESSIDEAIEIYSGLTKVFPGNSAASVGLARCYTKKNDYEKANGILNFVLSGKPFHETVSYFEEAYLMKAYITEKETNFNSAQHFIYLALELNMCCKIGWEMSAKVHRNRKMYSEASIAYGYCWDLCDHNDPEVGYNYAYCCMKAKKYDTALIICREVMNIYPEYKNLREKVLEPTFRHIKR